MALDFMDGLPNDIAPFETSVTGIYIATDAVEPDKLLRSTLLDRKKCYEWHGFEPITGRRYPMRLLMIAIVVILLAGCAIVPFVPYAEPGPPYGSSYYAPPAYGYYGYGYYGPRYDGHYQGRGYYDRGGYGRYR